MSEILTQAAAQLIVLVMGSISTGVFWLAKTLWRAQKDIDAAHEKLRDMQEVIDKLKG